MEIIKQVKIKPWHVKLREQLEVGEKKAYAWEDRYGIRNAISQDLPDISPEMEFTTKSKRTDKGVKYLEVERIK